MKYSKSFVAGLLASAVACSAFAAEITSAELDSSLQTISARCTQQLGYDPAKPGEVDEHALAPNEKVWRECVYAGIRAELMPRSSVPETYEQAIAQDLEFTAAIEAGRMTRYERWQQNRMSKQIVVANESMAADGDVKRQQELMSDFQRRQVETLLRVPPPQLMRVR